MKDGKIESFDEFMDIVEARERDAISKSGSNGLLWGVVKWINDNPILNGMEAFESKERAIAEAREQEEMLKQMPKVADIRYTIIEIKIAP